MIGRIDSLVLSQCGSHCRGLRFFFAPPHHSWERGTNENTNGLIRQYLPKGTSMKSLTQEDCDWIANELNERPRERYHFRAPSELFQ